MMMNNNTGTATTATTSAAAATTTTPHNNNTNHHQSTIRRKNSTTTSTGSNTSSGSGNSSNGLFGSRLSLRPTTTTTTTTTNNKNNATTNSSWWLYNHKNRRLYNNNNNNNTNTSATTSKRNTTLFSNNNNNSHHHHRTSSYLCSYQWMTLLCCITIVCFQFITVLPILFVQQQQQQQQSSSSSTSSSTSRGNHPIPTMNTHRQQSQQQQQLLLSKSTLSQYPTRTTKDGRIIPIFTMTDLSTIYLEYDYDYDSINNNNNNNNKNDQSLLRGINADLVSTSSSSLSLSSSSLPPPPEALIGAQHATIVCPDLNVNSMAYWNDPIGTRDRNYHSPFDIYNNNNNDNNDNNDNDKNKVYYISFAPDAGGWNNIRMSMEIIFVIAAATGRTLILPPKEPLYLLHYDTKQKHRGFADFFPIHTLQFQSIVKTITFEEFLIKEGPGNGPLSVNAWNLQQQQQPTNTSDTTTTTTTTAVSYEQLLLTADHCEQRKNSETSCTNVYNYLKYIGHTPDISASHSCVIFNEEIYHDQEVEISIEVQEYIQLICGEKRQQIYFNHIETKQHQILHFQSDQQKYRLLTHFYNIIHFTNPMLDHYYKRFVRNFLHYHDSIYCAAGKIVKAVQLESALISLQHQQQQQVVVAGGGGGGGAKADPNNNNNNNDRYLPDKNGAGGYSALHVRRGDLQYKKVKISAAEWYNNTQEVWYPNEVLYIATDERDKSFFNDLAKHHTLRFLDDYWDMAGLSDLDPNYMGMIDTIVASRGRAFAGTWFSTFSGYINRLRGYHGMSMNQSWYSFVPKKTAVQQWHIVDDFVYAYEFPDGWIGIDLDTFPTRDIF